MLSYFLRGLVFLSFRNGRIKFLVYNVIELGYVFISIFCKSLRFLLSDIGRRLWFRGDLDSYLFFDIFIKVIIMVLFWSVFVYYYLIVCGLVFFWVWLYFIFVSVGVFILDI